MAHATVEFYTQDYLLGRKPQLPLSEFPFWAERAAEHINQYTFNRINDVALVTHGAVIKRCNCELAEFLYMNEGSENKESESVKGRAVTYLHGTEYRMCQRHLGMTGLMYRGAGYVAEGFGKDDDNAL